MACTRSMPALRLGMPPELGFSKQRFAIGRIGLISRIEHIGGGQIVARAGAGPFSL